MEYEKQEEHKLPVDTGTAEHYVWGGVCDGWHLLKNQDLSIIQERVPAGAAEIRHYHLKAHQFFYILSGAATIEFEDHAVSLTAGQGIDVPRGIIHCFKNPSEQDVLFLVISAPSTQGDRFNID